MFLMPRCSSVSRMATAFCSYQREHHRERQVVDAAIERPGQGHGDLDRRVGVVALADVQQPRNAADVAELELVEAVLAAGQREDHAVLGHVSRRTRCSSCGRACAPSQPPTRKKWRICPAFTASITLSATPSTALWPKPMMIVFVGPSSVKPGAARAAVDHRLEIRGRRCAARPAMPPVRW